MRIFKHRHLILLFMLPLLLLSGCGFPGLTGTDDNTVKIAVQSSTESNIMGNVVAQLIEHELGYKTTLLPNLGSTTVTHQP